MIQPQSNAVFSWTQTSNVSRLPRAPVRILVSEPESRWREQVKARLKGLVDDLEAGWDGYQGKPVSFANAMFAMRMLEATCGFEVSAPQIVPGSSGDLQIEWHTAKGDIELHVKAPNDVHAWRSGPGEGSDGEELLLTTDFAVVAVWVKELAEASIAPSTAAA